MKKSNLWIEKYKFSRQGASVIDNNIKIYNKIIKTIDIENSVEDFPQCPQIKDALSQYCNNHKQT